MTTSKRHRERIEREQGCRTAQRTLAAAERARSPLADPALRRMYPVG